MVREEFVLEGRRCLLLTDGAARPACLLVQTLGRHEEPAVAREVALLAGLAEGTGVPFAMAFFGVSDWAADLMPWPDPKVDRRPEVGRRAGQTLRFVTDTLLPVLRERFGDLPVILGGYSLGGLFALWAAMQTDAFAAVAAASPSLWIRDWLPYAGEHPVRAGAVYLSLGDREEHVRNSAIARVGDCVRAQHELLEAQLGASSCTFRRESGGHFDDNDARLARAFAWCLDRIRQPDTV